MTTPSGRWKSWQAFLSCKKLGTQATAEDVETQEQPELFPRPVCDVLQGYFFGRLAVLECGQQAGTIGGMAPKKAGTANR
ncbi:hypothetical protein BOA8489_03070 [Boseongicola aestuarii]|uniref:EAL domain-containing protein n=1 Tax=Boseongicola aestuarii TaxID=1470561 RepID=A0A238J2U2_9RHOB|nr:hypothetical protein BOA8489_03070 [Boseongicola aestuarii]